MKIIAVDIGTSRIKTACFDETGAMDSKRKEMKNLVKELKKLYPMMDQNIFMAHHNVNLDTCVGYYKDHKYHSFLDEYEEGEDDGRKIFTPYYPCREMLQRAYPIEKRAPSRPTLDYSWLQRQEGSGASIPQTRLLPFIR